MIARSGAQLEIATPERMFGIEVGAVDYGALTDGRPQELDRNPDGSFQLFRIGDAVASRNIHAAIYDALLLVKDL